MSVTYNRSVVFFEYSGFLLTYDITEILLKVALNTINQTIYKNKWVSDCCCLTPTEQFCSYIMTRTSCCSLTETVRHVIPLKQILLPAKQSLVLYYSFMLSGEATNTNFLVFVWPGLRSNLWSTPLETNTLTITPRRQFFYTINYL